MLGSPLPSRYLIDSELGRVGTRVVYRAQDTLPDHPVAIKVLSSESLGTEGRAPDQAVHGPRPVFRVASFPGRGPAGAGPDPRRVGVVG